MIGRRDGRTVILVSPRWGRTVAVHRGASRVRADRGSDFASTSTIEAVAVPGGATATIRGGNIHDMAILPSAFRAKRVVNLHPRDTLRAGDVAGVSPCLVAPAATAALPPRPYLFASSRARRSASRTWPSAGVSFLPNNLDA